MFGKKNKNKIVEELDKNIQVIPDDFYGGKDPVVHYAGERNLAKGKQGVSPDKKFRAKTSSTSNGIFARIKNFFSHKAVLYSALGILFLAFVGGVTWYYLNQAGFVGQSAMVVPESVVDESKTSLEVDSATDVVIEPAGEEILDKSEMDLSATNTQVEVVDLASETKPLSLEDRPIDFPRIILTDSVDIDSDNLTDLEEEIFGTDSGVWDTDNDGYYDGQEVVNLYNPKGLAPVKLIDSGLIREYVNPVWQYRIYYPIVWEQGTVDTESRQVLFSSITGDYVEVLVYQKNNQENFVDWFARKALGEKYSELSTFATVFQEESYKRRDGLVYYFVRGNNIYVLVYHPGVTGFIPFRNTVQFMANSFRPSKTIINIPDQVVLPTAPDYSLLETGVDVTTTAVEDVDFIDKVL